MMHELSHTQGLDDVSLDSPQTPGSSVMNAFVGPNDCIRFAVGQTGPTGQPLSATRCANYAPYANVGSGDPKLSQCDISMMKSIYDAKPAAPVARPSAGGPGGGGNGDGGGTGGNGGTTPPSCDADGDGYGTAPWCEHTDCDDSNYFIHPTQSTYESCANWYLLRRAGWDGSIDVDCDGQYENDYCYSYLGGMLTTSYLADPCEYGLCGIDVPEAVAGESLLGEHYLNPGEIITSSNGAFSLTFQPDGNLVLYNQSWDVVWQTMTFGSPGTTRMRADGGLVIYDSNGNTVWDSVARGSFDENNLCFLRVEDDGRLVIYSPYDGPIWTSDGGPTGYGTGGGGDGGGGGGDDPPPPPPTCQEYGLMWNPSGSVACSDTEQACWETYTNPCTDAVWWIEDLYCASWECAWWY